MSKMEPVPEWLKRVTNDYSTDRFSPEFDGFKYNHMYQKIIALWQIGANESQCRCAADICSKGLEPAVEGKESVDTGHKLLLQDRLKELLGKRICFNDLIAHFRQRLVDLGNDIDLLINKELPALLPSIGHPAFHGIIQMGYGYIANDERLVCEGLAFLHFAYIPCVVSEASLSDEGDPDADILDILKEVKDGHLTSFADKERLYFNDERDGSKFLPRVYTLFTLKGNELWTLAKRVKLPDWFDRNDFDADQLRRLSKWILDKAILIYIMSERRNNFFILHGVTSAWALCQILPLLTDRHQALQTINMYLTAILTTYAAVECPALSMENLTGLENVSWEEIIKKNLEINSEEHVYKVVHACSYAVKENQEEDMTEVYRKAAQIVTYYPYTNATAT